MTPNPSPPAITAHALDALPGSCSASGRGAGSERTTAVSRLRRLRGGVAKPWALVLLATVGGAFAEAPQEGAVYVGDLADGRRHGHGVLTWGNGHRYEGAFANGRRHGEGELALPSGDRYEGAFSNGSMHGAGRYSWPNGDVFTGDFVAGERTGRGIYSWHTGERYEGELVAGVPEGQGAYAYADGAVYKGRFKAGRRVGRGALEWANGNRYVGEFDADQRHGLGHFRWRDGTVYKGRFAFGRQHGPGVKATVEGGLFFQKWNDGELVTEREVAAVPRCALDLNGAPWMFNGPRCINGLAHGDGDAVRLDGQSYVVNARFVLGRLVSGTPESLVLD